METSIILAKVLGIFTIVKGLFILFKKADCKKLVDEMIDSHSATIVIGAVEFLAALFLVINHNVWSGGFPVVITLIGWIMLIDGLFALLMPHKTIMKIYKKINKDSFYNFGIVFCFVIGIYLTLAGFSY